MDNRAAGVARLKFILMVKDFEGIATVSDWELGAIGVVGLGAAIGGYTGSGGANIREPFTVEFGESVARPFSRRSFEIVKV